MSVEIFRSSDFLVTEEAGVIRLEQISAAGFGPALVTLVVALAGSGAALLVHHLLGPSNPAATVPN